MSISIWKARLVDHSAFIVFIELKLSVRPIGFASDSAATWSNLEDIWVSLATVLYHIGIPVQIFIQSAVQQSADERHILVPVSFNSIKRDWGRKTSITMKPGFQQL